MRQLEIFNPFGAPVFHEETVGSTMDVSKVLAREGSPHGTVICADFQEAGRGRIPGRLWDAGRRESLLFTALLRFPGIEGIPRALTLRTGLAVALAIEDFSPALKNKAMIKWPNDIMLPAPMPRGVGAQNFLKAAGILTEADGRTARIGIGVNVAQREFPGGLRDKAASIAIASGAEIESGQRFALLEKILAHLRRELETQGAPNAWRECTEARLYMKGAKASFAEGPAGSAQMFAAAIAGIGPDGELLIIPDGETEARAFVAGEQLQRP